MLFLCVSVYCHRVTTQLQLINIIIIIIIICIQNMKLVTNKFKSGGLHEKHVMATWNLGNHLSICL